MKKFILVFLLFAPSIAFADTLGCAVGALVLGGIGAQIGGGVVPKILATTGAFAGCSAGSRIEDGTYGVQQAPIVTRTVTVVNSGTPAATYSGTPAPTQGVPCPEHWEGTYLMREGYQRAQKNGGITRDGCGGVQRVQNVSQAVYTTTETRQAPPQKQFGPTVHNYAEEVRIHPACKTENPGADGNCLLRMYKGLVLEQLACNGETVFVTIRGAKTKVLCPKDYNAGLWAGVYDRLGKELVARQTEMQGGKEFVRE